MPSILVLADTPEPYQRSFRALQAALEHSFDQRLVGQPLPCNAVNEAVEPLQGMPLHIALIEPESEPSPPQSVVGSTRKAADVALFGNPAQSKPQPMEQGKQ
jgi:hypothetical protein